MAGTIKHKWLWRGFAAGFAVLTLSIGFLAGFYTAKHVGTDHLTGCYKHKAGQPAPEESVQLTQYSRGMPLPGYELRELPAPWSQEAVRVQANPGSAGADASAVELYTLYSDAQAITEQLTAAFLQHMQQHYASTGQNITASDSDLTEVLTVFRSVARDVLSYLRFHNSQVLLPLLRQYSQTRSLSITDVDPDVLQQEVQRLLNVDALNDWYAVASMPDHPSVTTMPFTLRGSAQGAAQLQGSTSDDSDSDSNSGRRLLSVTPRARQHTELHAHPARHLHAAAAPAPAAPPAKQPVAGSGAPIPIIPQQEAKAEQIPPTVSPLMDMQAMLCIVQSFSPTGLQGMLLPSGVNGTGKGTPITCEPLPKPGIFRYQGLTFKPVKIPVVFHCQRFLQGDVLQPPLWKAEEAAANLIKVTNQLFNRSYIEFELQEVRSDVKKYPYLLLGSLNDWQQCTGNPSQEASGFPCLAETAQDPAFAALTKKYVLNVIVGGSSSAPFCNGTKEELCTSLYMGYTGSIGPWFTRPSATWSEASLGENWVFITWDMFVPSVRNARRFWDGGAVTLAHEFGHYLGLMHTHEGAVACEGDGLDKADSVPDTPVNLQTIQWAAKEGLAVSLARWCGEFRTGKKPAPKELLRFNSCKLDPLAIDNVFNLLSYLPDQCCMLMTPNQIARLQWAVARFRPKMMALYAVKS